MSGSLPAPTTAGPMSPPYSNAARALVRSRAFELALVALLSAMGFVAATLAMGRDLNWDYFNYHAYAVQQVLQDRTGQDFFAAGMQGYLNPIPYAPMAAMTAWGWHSAAIAAALAVVQSTSAVFLYLISHRLIPAVERHRLLAGIAVLLGLANGAYWSQVGSTFIDATLAPLVMSALWLALDARRWPAWIASSALVGIAAALKLTNVPFAIGLWVALMFSCTGPATRAARMLVATVTMVAGFLVFYGPWGWTLQQLHGSPVFPLFNHLFESPDFQIQNSSFLRFVPMSVGQLVGLPWDMAQNKAWVYTEVPAPDLRPLALAVAVIAIALKSGYALIAGAKAASHDPDNAKRVVTVFFLSSLVLWIATSTNGRYAAPLLMLLGPLFVLSAVRLVGLRLGRIIVLLLLALQLIHAASAGSPRWSPQPWTDDWLSAEVPERLKKEPALYLTIGASSESYLASYVHPNSSLVNPIGMLSIETEGPGWDRFVTLRERFVGRTWVVFRASSHEGAVLDESLRSVYDELVDRLGLTIQGRDCESLKFNVPTPQWKPPLARNFETELPRRLLACSAVHKSTPSPMLAEQRAVASEVMDALEARCPTIFRPAGGQTEGSSGLWTRRYLTYDLFLHVDYNTDTVFFRQDRQMVPIQIARLSKWREDLASFACGLPHGGTRGTNTLRPPTP